MNVSARHGPTLATHSGAPIIKMRSGRPELGLAGVGAGAEFKYCVCATKLRQSRDTGTNQSAHPSYPISRSDTTRVQPDNKGIQK